MTETVERKETTRAMMRTVMPVAATAGSSSDSRLLIHAVRE